MIKRSTDVSAWVSHFSARKLRVDEAIAELKWAERIYLAGGYAAAKDKLAAGRLEGGQTVLNST